MTIKKIMGGGGGKKNHINLLKIVLKRLKSQKN